MHKGPSKIVQNETAALSQGAIQSMAMPSRFKLSKDGLGGLGMNWLKSLRAVQDDDVEIALFYRGSPCSAASAETFRLLLKTELAVIFDYADEIVELDVINQLAAVLGNCKNNQISNHNIGNAGPRFYLEKINVIRISSKSVMLVQGYFHDPDGDIRNHLMGIFFDASPDDLEQSRIEELVFQAPNFDLFNKYMPDFLATLQSIRWTA